MVLLDYFSVLIQLQREVTEYLFGAYSKAAQSQIAQEAYSLCMCTWELYFRR